MDALSLDIFSLQFLSALLAIIVIDLVLAGDNAIVIALASRKLPAELQKRVIIWGTVGAIVVRGLLTLVVVWLLKIPGLLLAGGALLIWIAYRLLLADDDGGAEGKVKSVVGFWAAIQTIVVADLVMGLDNVLAVAGAAQGSYVLVILGLLISVPIVVWGSTIVLRWVERFPVIVYIGAGVLAWTAAKMMMSEPLVKSFFEFNGLATALVYIVSIGGVLWIGFAKNHRKLESGISARLERFARPSNQSDVEVNPQGDSVMQKILVPVDGSSDSEFALRHVATEFLKNGAMHVHLLNVRPAMPRHISRFVSKKSREAFRKDEAEKVLGPARKLLANHGVPCSAHTVTGERAATIVAESQRLGCSRIVMGTARKSSLTRMLQDSTTNKVLEHTTVPVELIAGSSISKLERYGLPAGLGGAVAMLLAVVID